MMLLISSLLLLDKWLLLSLINKQQRLNQLSESPITYILYSRFCCKSSSYPFNLSYMLQGSKYFYIWYFPS
jgi:hypothetical protein